MTGRRLTDRIRELCAKALDRSRPDWDSTLSDLQFAIREHSLRLENMSVAASLAGLLPAERRKSPEINPIPHKIRTLFALHTHMRPRNRAGAHGRKSRFELEPSSRSKTQRR